MLGIPTSLVLEAYKSRNLCIREVLREDVVWLESLIMSIDSLNRRAGELEIKVDEALQLLVNMIHCEENFGRFR